MLAKVADKILEKAKLSVNKVERIICSADPGDAAAPDTAAAVQAKIGVTCPAYGVSMSCTGWIAGMDIALNYLAKGEHRILVLASSLVGSRLYYYNFMHRAIFGDGAGGVLLESRHRERFLAIGQITDGKYYSKIYVPYPWSIPPSEIPIDYKGSFYMSDDQEIFFAALNYYLPRFTNWILKKANIRIENIDHFLFHYPSKPLFEHSIKLLGIPKEKTYSKFYCYGNLVAAEMPILLDEAISIGRIRKDDIIFILTYGAGFTMGGLIMQY